MEVLPGKHSLSQDPVGILRRTFADIILSTRGPEVIDARNGLRIVLIVALAHGILWTLAAALTHSAPPLDMTLGLAWGAEWPIGTQKHPPLQAWMLEVAWQSAGMWGIAALAAFTVSITLPLIYGLGVRLVAPVQALVGTLLVLGIYYFSWPVPEFNHNTLQIPIWVALILVFDVCLGGGKARWWVLLGVLSAAAVMAKYFSVVLLTTMLGWLFYDRNARRYVITPWPWIALATCLLLLEPHLRWLLDTGVLPLRYVTEREAGGSRPLHFLLVQIFDMSPALVLSSLAVLLRPGADAPPAGPNRNDRFLFVFTWGPLVLLVAAALLTGSRLRDMWGAPLLSLTGLYLAHSIMPRWNAPRLGFVMRGAAILMVSVPVIYALYVCVLPKITSKVNRVNYPLTAAARQIGDIYRGTFGGVPAVVVGDEWYGGLTALGLHVPRVAGRPKVLFDGDRSISPWVRPEDLCRGIVMVWIGDPVIPPEFAHLSGPCPQAPPIVRTLTIPYPQFPGVVPLRLEIAMIGPSRS